VKNTIRAQIMQLLQCAPDGMTTAEIAKQLGLRTDNISSQLSKMRAYGHIDRVQSKNSNVSKKWLCKS